MMKDKSKEQIDELLSSFIDGELGERDRTEVKRLIAHDAAIARRLAELEQCRNLLQGVPRERAPEHLAEAVTESLERKLLLSEESHAEPYRVGARQLLLRRVAAAAAMVALIAVLGAVVFNIVRPGPDGGVRVAQRQPAPDVSTAAGGVSEPAGPETAVSEASESMAAVPAERCGQMWLVLATDEHTSTAGALQRAISNNQLTDCVTINRRGPRTTYTFNCGLEGLEEFVPDLEVCFSRARRRELVVAGRSLDSDVTVEDVRLEQVASLIREADGGSRLAMASDLAALNRLYASLPGGEAEAALRGDIYDALKVAKPVLTGGRKSEPSGSSAAGGSAILTIVATSLK